MSTNNKGLVYVFSGDGKGKTSAAIGTTIRSLAHGRKVVWISWYKTSTWSTGEKILSKILSIKYRKNLSMYWMGKGFYFRNKETFGSHKEAAGEALSLAKSIQTDLLVLDEVLMAIADGLVTKKDLLNIIRERGNMNIVITGRGDVSWLISCVDLVSEINKIKHPFDLGKLAVEGLDF